MSFLKSEVHSRCLNRERVIDTHWSVPARPACLSWIALHCVSCREKRPVARDKRPDTFSQRALLTRAPWSLMGRVLLKRFYMLTKLNKLDLTKHTHLLARLHVNDFHFNQRESGRRIQFLCIFFHWSRTGQLIIWIITA